MSLFNKKSKLELYSEAELNELDKFISETFGEFPNVLHEIASPDIHVDIAVIPPNAYHNYYTLMTMGMGAHRMNVPKEYEKYKYERAEIAVSLPPDWDLHSGDEKWYWPIRWLKILARYPIENNTWLGWWHTVQNNGPFAENTKLCCILLLGAFCNIKKYEALKLSSGNTINFYQMFPIYEEEMKYKISHGAEALIDLFDEEAATPTPVININRKNYCSKDK